MFLRHFYFPAMFFEPVYHKIYKLYSKKAIQNPVIHWIYCHFLTSFWLKFSLLFSTVQTFSPNVLNEPVFPVFWLHFTFPMMFDGSLRYPSPLKVQPANPSVGKTSRLSDSATLIDTIYYGSIQKATNFSLFLQPSEGIRIKQVSLYKPRWKTTATVVMVQRV